MAEPRQINFTIVPEDKSDQARVYANFCAIAHTPFDFTLTFCEVLPLSEKDIQEAAADHVIHAPVRARIVVPPLVISSLIAALQDQLRGFTEADPSAGWDKAPVH